MKPLISILVPAYNHEKYVQETIQSIIDQTYENIELIVIDDGSKDNTWQKIQQMKDVCEKRFSRVVFETQENEGTCGTYNKMLALANGEYIGIIASDDKYKPEAIEKEYEFLSKNPDYAVCVGDNEIIDSNSQKCYWDKNRNYVYDICKAKYKTFGDFLKQYKDIDFNSEQFGSYSSLYMSNYIPNGKLIRKTIYKKIGNYQKEAPLEDWWEMLQMSKYGKMKYLDEVLFSYRWHENNTIKNRKKMNDFAKRTIKYENNFLEEINKNNNFEQYLPTVKDIYVNGAMRVARNYFHVVKVKTHTIPKDKIKNIIIEILGINIFSYKKSI